MLESGSRDVGLFELFGEIGRELVGEFVRHNGEDDLRALQQGVVLIDGFDKERHQGGNPAVTVDDVGIPSQLPDGLDDTFGIKDRPRVVVCIENTFSIVILGLPFEEVYRRFLEWCGEDYVLCTWGDSDISILKANLKIHGLSSEINDRFLDIQPLFGRVAENTAQQRSVAYAVDFYRIPQTDDFHSAERDAWYEARILKEALIDYFVIRSKDPGNEKDCPHLRTYISNPNLTTQKKWRSEVFSSEKEAIKMTLREPMNCPICEAPLDCEIEWFASGHTWLSLWMCPTHGSLSGKVRAKRTPKQEFFGGGQLRFVNGNAARYVREKWQEKNEKEDRSAIIASKCEDKCEEM